MKGVYKVLYIMDINPEPWTPGSPSIGFKGKQRYPKIAKDQRLIDYQEGIKTSVQQAYTDLLPFPEGIDLHLVFKFWRMEDEYTAASGRTAHRNVADATNLTKALEDALQGVLYKNDRQVKHSEGEIVMEGKDIHPRILIMCAERVRDPYWQELANSYEVAQRPMPPGNVYHTNRLFS